MNKKDDRINNSNMCFHGVIHYLLVVRFGNDIYSETEYIKYGLLFVVCSTFARCSGIKTATDSTSNLHRRTMQKP